MTRSRILITSIVLGSLLAPGLAIGEMERDLQAAGGFFKWIGDQKVRIKYNNDFNVAGFVSDQRPTNEPVTLDYFGLNVVADGSKRFLKRVRAEGIGQSEAASQDFNRRQTKFQQVMVKDISPEIDALIPELEETYDFRWSSLGWAIDPNLIGSGSGTHSAYSLGVQHKGKESPNDLTAGIAWVDYGDWHDHHDLDFSSVPASALLPLLTALLPDLLKQMEERPER